MFGSYLNPFDHRSCRLLTPGGRQCPDHLSQGEFPSVSRPDLERPGTEGNRLPQRHGLFQLYAGARYDELPRSLGARFVPAAPVDGVENTAKKIRKYRPAAQVFQDEDLRLGMGGKLGL